MVLATISAFDRYQIDSDSGAVHSSFSGKVLKSRPDTGGRLQVALYRGDGVPHRRYIHHLVLETFVGPRPEGMKGLHYDDDPLNNHVSNLYWGTTSQNTYDAVRNGRHAHARKVECKRGHPLKGDNLQPWSKYGRGCLACNRAVGHARYLGHQKDEDFIAKLADVKFAEIMVSAGGD